MIELTTVDRWGRLVHAKFEFDFNYGWCYWKDSEGGLSWGRRTGAERNITWLAGHVPFDTEEAQAFLAAWALRK